MKVYGELLGVPGLTALACLAFGACLIAAPRRMVGMLADSLGFFPDFDVRGGIKKLTAGLRGAALIGFAVFLGIRTWVLAEALFATR